MHRGGHRAARLGAGAEAEAAGTAAIMVATAVIRIGRRRTGPALLHRRRARRARSCSRTWFGVVDEDDRVLLHDAHQQQQADHAEDVERLAA